MSCTLYICLVVALRRLDEYVDVMLRMGLNKVRLKVTREGAICGNPECNGNELLTKVYIETWLGL